MNKEIDRINAQLTKYFQNVITNAATNYYKKKFSLQEKEISSGSSLVELENISFEDNSPFATISILSIPLTVENDSFLHFLETLSKKEQFFLIEKFVFNKTDKEIGSLLGISRQGATNLKHRMYNKFRHHL